MLQHNLAVDFSMCTTLQKDTVIVPIQLDVYCTIKVMLEGNVLQHIMCSHKHKLGLCDPKIPVEDMLNPGFEEPHCYAHCNSFL